MGGRVWVVSYELSRMSVSLMKVFVFGCLLSIVIL